NGGGWGAVAEPVRDIPADIEVAPTTPTRATAAGVERREGTPQGTETRSQPNRNEKHATGNEAASDPPPRPTPAPRNRPSAWDSLDARHWIVFSSSWRPQERWGRGRGEGGARA